MISRKGSFVSGVIVAMVLGSGTAYAATGGNFKLGGKNTATSVTSLVNSQGTALKLTSKAGTAPLAVTSGTKVANLNADRLDGLTSVQFLRSTGKATDANMLDGLSSEQFLRSTGKAVDAESVDGLDSGALALAAGGTSYVVANGTFVDVNADMVADFLIAIATCPAGTKLTGGGNDNFTSYAGTYYDSPNNGNAWIAAAATDPTVDAVDDLQAYAICYNPRGGAVAGTTSTLSLARAQAHATDSGDIDAATVATLARVHAKRR
jgi:hypothetical protein